MLEFKFLRIRVCRVFILMGIGFGVLVKRIFLVWFEIISVDVFLLYGFYVFGKRIKSCFEILLL